MHFALFPCNGSYVFDGTLSKKKNNCIPLIVFTSDLKMALFARSIVINMFKTKTIVYHDVTSILTDVSLKYHSKTDLKHYLFKWCLNNRNVIYHFFVRSSINFG